MIQIVVHSHKLTVEFILLEFEIDSAHIDHKVWQGYLRLQPQRLIFLWEELHWVVKPLNDYRPLREAYESIEWEFLLVQVLEDVPDGFFASEDSFLQPGVPNTHPFSPIGFLVSFK